MKEIRKGNKAVQIVANGIFYGQYYENEFQVLKSKFDCTTKQIDNFIKKWMPK